MLSYCLMEGQLGNKRYGKNNGTVAIATIYFDLVMGCK